MTKIDFTSLKGRIIAFELSGHSAFSDENDIVCAAVSSAAYMTANTITEIYGIGADILLDESKGFLSLSLSFEDAGKCRELLEGFALHMKSLSAQYPDNINCLTSNI